MGNKESNESAAVKRQAEGGANPMYELLDLSGKPISYLFETIFCNISRLQIYYRQIDSFQKCIAVNLITK